jgi:membrane protease YdiL (CAAX protease family)
MSKKPIILFIYNFLVAYALIFFSPTKCFFRMKDLFLGFFLGCGIYIFCFIKKLLCVKNTLPLKKNSLYKNTNKYSSSIFTLLLGYIPATVIEELFFRSYIFFLSMKYFPIYVSILINAILFYLVHVDRRKIELIVSGIIYCLAVIYTNNILTSIVAHLTYNITAFLLQQKANI